MCYSVTIHLVYCSYHSEFSHFIKHYEKSYSQSEYRTRLAAFNLNYRNMKAKNALLKSGEAPWVVTQFFDLSKSEFSSRMLRSDSFADVNAHIKSLVAAHNMANEKKNVALLDTNTVASLDIATETGIASAGANKSTQSTMTIPIRAALIRNPLSTTTNDANLQVLTAAQIATLRTQLPESIDYREHENFDILGQLRDQGRCGSCFSHAAASVASSAVALLENKGRTKEPFVPHKVFSAQPGLDCVRPHYSCTHGGNHAITLDALLRNRLTIRETHYPSFPEDRPCDWMKLYSHAFDCSKHLKAVHVPGSEEQIVYALMRYGPLLAAVDGSPLQLYSPGRPVDDSQCGFFINHSVVIVGVTKEYFILRNSWGLRDGEHAGRYFPNSNGYYYVKRGGKVPWWKASCALQNYVFAIVRTDGKPSL